MGVTRENRDKNQEVSQKLTQSMARPIKADVKVGDMGLQGTKLKAHYLVTQPITRTCDIVGSWLGFTGQSSRPETTAPSDVGLVGLGGVAKHQGSDLQMGRTRIQGVEPEPALGGATVTQGVASLWGGIGGPSPRGLLTAGRPNRLASISGAHCCVGDLHAVGSRPCREGAACSSHQAGPRWALGQ